jgi:hypothetical protein
LGCTLQVSPKLSALNFETINFDTSLLNKKFVDSGSCIVDLEQWAGFKGSVSGSLNYCWDTKLRGV